MSMLSILRGDIIENRAASSCSTQSIQSKSLVSESADAKLIGEVKVMCLQDDKYIAEEVLEGLLNEVVHNEESKQLQVEFGSH